MANLNETSVWEDGIYQFETTDPVQGGPDGIDNVPTRQLANRTRFLKDRQADLAEQVENLEGQVESLAEAVGEAASAEALESVITEGLAAREITAGNGLTGGGDLSADRTVALGTPGTLSGNTSNAVTAESHTHALSAATTTLRGVVELATSTETVTGTDATRAVTPAGLSAALAAFQGGGSIVTLSGETAVYVGQTVTYTITNYSAFSTYSATVSAGSVTLSGSSIAFTAPNTAQTVTLTVTMDGNDNTFTLTVRAAGVEKPSATSPGNGATNQNGTLTLSASAFSWVGLSDTHASSDWQLSTSSSFSSPVQSLSASTANKTSWTVSGLAAGQMYYWRVRYRSAGGRVSDWSNARYFVTKTVFAGAVGTQGGQGFGVGVYPHTLPSGFTAMSGAEDPASDNYGNYQYSDGSVMVFIPRFYYRFGHSDSPRYAVYGANAIDIVGADTFATEAEANAAGYAMHRAFKDGGEDKSGFFIDKYLCSINANETGVRSVKNGVPVSLSDSFYVSGSAPYACTARIPGTPGGFYGAPKLARARGDGFNVASIFMFSALALLSLAHAQSSSHTTYCAWYNPAANYPKGCQKYGLVDKDDPSVIFTGAGDRLPDKPLTGSGTPFAKTTHNGQACGVADVNSAWGSLAIGATTERITGEGGPAGENKLYVLKSSVKLADMSNVNSSGTPSTYGNYSTSLWGYGSNWRSNYSAVSFPWGITERSDGRRVGNGSNAVFSGAMSGTDWLRTACGIPLYEGVSSSGSNLFGNDSLLSPNGGGYTTDQAAPFAGRDGIFSVDWNECGSGSTNATAGFRAAAYGQ